MSDWDRAQEVFLMTADLSPEERPPLLDRLCADDQELRVEVESLLAWDHSSGTIVAKAVQGEASLLFDSATLAGKRVGAYRIIREIGRGGMGAVYLADRDDEEYQKQVAIKVVKPGMDTAEVLDRFRYERQILANLDHPNIAKLFDGGSTTDGLPFFVMEYVEGRPVNSFCRESTLSNRARCELFLRILGPVSYAHRNLVVHRDLKPGNILVTADGTPKLLDFGIAKLVSGNPDGSQTGTTVLRPFTPEYASPEQVRGLSVTTSTDIYSLGAVFYEMLTEQRAQPITSTTPQELERAICHDEPPRPSEIAPSVSADLDNIVFMAMRKEPERRYHSVDQFAEDIQRYLDGKPIVARQDSLSYRLRKFLVRNAFETAAIALVLVSLATGLAISIQQARRAKAALRVAESQRLVADHETARAEAEARHAEASQSSEAKQRDIAQQQSTLAEKQRDAAQREKSIAEQRLADMLQLADRTLFNVHDSVAKLPGSMAARKEIVNTTLEYLERLEKESGLDDEMRITLAAAYYKVSLIQGTFGAPSLQDYAGAKASLLKGEAVIRPLYLKRNGDPQVMTRWIQIEEALGDLDYQDGNDREAIVIDLALLPTTRRIAHARPGNRADERQESELECRLANSYLRMASHEGLEHAERGTKLLRDQISRYPDDTDSKEVLASLLVTAAVALKEDGDLDQAARNYLEAIQIREEMLRNQPHDTRNRRNLIVDYGDYAGTLGIPDWINLGRPAEARIFAAKAVALAQESVDADPQDATARYDLGMVWGISGTIDPPPDGVKDSLASLEKAIGLIGPIAKANPNSATSAQQLASLLECRGHRLESLGRTADAIQSYRDSLEIVRPFMESADMVVRGQTISSEEALARAYSSAGNFTTALDFANRAVTLEEKRNVAPPPDEHRMGGLACAYATLAIVQEKGGNVDLARENAEKAQAAFRLVHNRGDVSIFAPKMAATEALLSRLSTSPQ